MRLLNGCAKSKFIADAFEAKGWILLDTKGTTPRGIMLGNVSEQIRLSIAREQR